MIIAKHLNNGGAVSEVAQKAWPVVGISGLWRLIIPPNFTKDLGQLWSPMIASNDFFIDLGCSPQMLGWFSSWPEPKPTRFFSDY